MATASRIAMKAVRHLFGTVIPKQEFKEGITQTFKRGAPVVVTGGYLVECGADPALIMGIATRDAQNGAANGTKSQVVEIAIPGMLFLGNLSDAADTAVTAQTDVGLKYDIAKHAGSGTWYVEKAGVAATRVVVWEIWLEGLSVIGDVRGRVLFGFDPDFCQGLQGA